MMMMIYVPIQLNPTIIKRKVESHDYDFDDDNNENSYGEYYLAVYEIHTC